MGNRLANPPDRVGNEFDIPIRIESFCRFHQAEVAFVDQIEKRHPKAAISLRIAHDKAQVAFNQSPHGAFVAMHFDAGAKLSFFFRSKARNASYRPKVCLEGIGIVLRPRHRSILPWWAARDWHVVYALRRGSSI